MSAQSPVETAPGASPEPKELIRGWLWKKHRKRQFWTGWHRRFFTLTVWPGEGNRARLRYYRSPPPLLPQEGHARGGLTLSSAASISGGLQKSVRHNFYRFEVFSATGEVVLLAGKTPEESSKWIEQLKTAIASAPAPRNMKDGAAPGEEDEEDIMVLSDDSGPDDDDDDDRVDDIDGYSESSMKKSQSGTRLESMIASGSGGVGAAAAAGGGNAAVAAGASTDSVKQGFLFRRPTFRRNFLAKKWHKRFFILSEDGRLEWFRVNYKRGLRFKNLRGTVILGGDCVIEFSETKQRSQGHVFWPFRLLLGSKSRLLLGAESLEEARDWVQTLRSMIDQGTGAGGGLETSMKSSGTIPGRADINAPSKPARRKKELTSRASVIVLDDMTDGEEDGDEDDTTAPPSLDHVSEDGWLLKQQSSRTWRRRYFVLNGSKLALFKSSRSARYTTVVSLGSNCYVDFPGHSVVRGGRVVYPFTLFSERDDNFATFVDGALRLAAFTYDGAARWSNALNQAAILAPRDRKNTKLSAFIEHDDPEASSASFYADANVTEGSVGPDGRTRSATAPIPGQPLCFGDKIRLFTRSAYSLASSDRGGHVGVYESYKRKYGGMLFAVPPVGQKAEYEFRTSTFQILRVDEGGVAVMRSVSSPGKGRARSNTVGRRRSDSEEKVVRYGDEFILVDLEHEKSQRERQDKGITSGYSSGAGSEWDEPGAAATRRKKNAATKAATNATIASTVATEANDGESLSSSRAKTSSSSSSAVTSTSAFSINNGISRRSGYLGPRELGSGGECRMVMTQTQVGARQGDPVCYGDSGVVIDIISSRGGGNKRFNCRLANFKKSTSKTVGGYLVAGVRAGANVLTFRIDGEVAWLGLDLTRRYLVNAIGCNVASPDTEHGLLSSRIDLWWGSVAASEDRKEKQWRSSNKSNSSGSDNQASTGARVMPCIDIKIGRAKHVQVRLPRRADRLNHDAATGEEKLQPAGYILRRPVPSLPSVHIEWRFDGVDLGDKSSAHNMEGTHTTKNYFFPLALAMLIGSGSGLVMQWARNRGASYDNIQTMLDGGNGMIYADAYVAAVSTAVACMLFMGHSTLTRVRMLMGNSAADATAHELTVSKTPKHSHQQDRDRNYEGVDFWSFRLVKRTRSRRRSILAKVGEVEGIQSDAGGATRQKAFEQRMRTSSFNLSSAKTFLLNSTMKRMSESEASMRRAGKPIHEAAGVSLASLSEHPTHSLSEGSYGKWGDVSASDFVVRSGPNYKRNRTKKPSMPAIYEILSADMFKTVLKPGHIVTRIHFPRETRNIICQRYRLAQNAGITIPTVVINTWECPLYVPPNPLWSHVLDGESLNMVYVGVLSEQYCAEVFQARERAQGSGRNGSGDGATAGAAGSGAVAAGEAAAAATRSAARSASSEDEPKPGSGGAMHKANTAMQDLDIVPGDSGPPLPLRIHDLWARILENKEDGIRNRMKLITTLGNPEDICVGPMDRGLAVKFNSTPVLIRPQHEFHRGVLSASDHHKDLDGIPYLDYVIDFHRFPYLSRVTAKNALPRMCLAQMYFAIVAEAREDDELPERLLWCLHIEQLQIDAAKVWEADAGAGE